MMMTDRPKRSWTENMKMSMPYLCTGANVDGCAKHYDDGCVFSSFREEYVMRKRCSDCRASYDDIIKAMVSHKDNDVDLELYRFRVRTHSTMN